MALPAVTVVETLMTDDAGNNDCRYCDGSDRYDGCEGGGGCDDSTDSGGCDDSDCGDVCGDYNDGDGWEACHI